MARLAVVLTALLALRCRHASADYVDEPDGWSPHFSSASLFFCFGFRLHACVLAFPFLRISRSSDLLWHEPAAVAGSIQEQLGSNPAALKVAAAAAPEGLANTARKTAAVEAAVDLSFNDEEQDTGAGGELALWKRRIARRAVILPPFVGGGDASFCLCNICWLD
jgi:hypothetical protein